MVQPVTPPTLQTLTYSTGAAFLVGRSAACAPVTMTRAADLRRRLRARVIFDPVKEGSASRFSSELNFEVDCRDVIREFSLLTLNSKRARRQFACPDARRAKLSIVP